MRVLSVLVVIAASAVLALAQPGREKRQYGGVIYKPLHDKSEQDLSKVPGIPGHDYPIFHSVPPTSFSCAHVPAVPGMYADVETACQAYRVCDGRNGEQGTSFLCTNGTLFNQKEFTCDWWYNVDCRQAPQLYNLNLDPIKNPYAPKAPKPEAPKEPWQEHEDAEYLKHQLYQLYLQQYRQQQHDAHPPPQQNQHY